MGEAEWRVEDAVLVSDAGSNGVLWSDKSYSDFELSFRFRLSEGANSGIYLRSHYRQMTNGADQVEIQLLDDPHFATQPGHGRTGAIFGLRAPAFRAYRPERWNDVTIRMAGRMIEVTLNGHEIQNASLDNVTSDFSKHPGLKAEGGFIGIQSYGAGTSGTCWIEFEDIKIVDLTVLPATADVTSETDSNQDWTIPAEFTDARPLTSLNRDRPVNAYVSLSEDGLDIYWTREGGNGVSEIRTASRPRVGIAFGPSRKVATGRHGVVAKDGCYIMYLRNLGGTDVELVESFRTSRFEKFDPPTPGNFKKKNDQPKGPSLSVDGKTVVFQQTASTPGKTQLMIAMRSRYDLDWEGPGLFRCSSRNG